MTPHPDHTDAPPEGPAAGPGGRLHRLGFGIGYALGFTARWTLRFLLLLAVVLLALYLLIQVPAVQRYAAGRASALLSRELGVEARVARIEVEPFSSVRLADVFLGDPAGDTLLVAAALRANFFQPVRSLLDGTLLVDAARLEGARLRLRRGPSHPDGNYAFLARYFSPRERDSLAAEPLRLDLHRVDLRGVRVSFDDAFAAISAEAALDSLDLGLDVFDLPGKRIAGESFAVRGLSLALERGASSAPTAPPPDSAASAPAHTPDAPFLSPFAIEFARVSLERAAFAYRDVRRRAGSERDVAPVGLDARRLDVRDVALHLADFSVGPDSLGVRVEDARLREANSGLEVRTLAVARASLTSRGADLEGIAVATERSRLGGRVAVRLPGGGTWADAARRARVDVDLGRSDVDVGELRRLVPALRDADALAGLPPGRIEVRGRLRGSTSSLRGSDLVIRLPDGSTLAADGSARNLLTPAELLVNAEVTEARTSVDRLRALLPGVRIPRELDRLGTLSFSGRFDGFLADFVAYGSLETDLGRATLDTRFVSVPGELPRYTGEAALIDFDLGAYTNNPDLGRVTVRGDIRDGRGLRPGATELSLIGDVESLAYRGYVYRDVAFDGTIAPEGFEGAVRFADEHVDLDFDGRIDLSEDERRFDFAANVRRLDLAPLRLTEEPWSVTGAVDIESNTLDPDNLEGTVALRQLLVAHADGRRYAIDEVVARQAIAPRGEKRLSVESPTLLVDLSGEYRLRTLPKTVAATFADTYPDLNAALGLPPSDSLTRDDSLATRISLDVQAVAVDSVLAAFQVPVRQLDGTLLAATLDTETERFDISVASPRPANGNLSLERLRLDLRGQNGELALEADAGGLDLGAFGFSDVAVFAEYVDGEVAYTVSADTATSFLGDVLLAGVVTLGDTAVGFTLDPSSFLDVGGERWTVEPGNELVLARRSITARDVELRAGDRSLSVETVGERGLDVLARRLDLSVLNGFLNPDKLQVDGELDLYLSARDVYAREGLTLSAAVDTFTVNDVDWGALSALVASDDLDTAALTTYLTFTRLGQAAVLDAAVALRDGVRVAGEPRDAGYFDAALTSEGFDMSFLSYFVPGIEDLRGKLGADLHVYGTPDEPIPEGGILVDDCALTVLYTGTRYYVDSQFVAIDRRALDATGRVIRDRHGNLATLTGGLTHENLRRWGLDLEIRTRRLAVLNTTAGDNPLYYGSAYADGLVTFDGPFNRTDIGIRATALRGTEVVFPVSGGVAEDELRFIRFREASDSTRAQAVAGALRGLALDMDLTVTPAAKLALVFDEASGDILEAQGEGKFSIDVERGGGYSMFGDYDVASGDYLFTLLNIVNKPFAIRPGGTITWDGDPFSAQLDITAAYENLQVAPSGLIPEYVSAFRGTADDRGDRLVELASQPTKVDLLLDLAGDLQRPDLTFAIQLPELQGEIRNYVNSKLALVRADENELNRQVFGLIVIGQFLPSFTELQASTVGFNTISELFSNQLSYLLTELFTSLAGEEGALSGIDIDINLQNSSSLNGTSGAIGNDLQTRLRTYFLDDRLEVGLGANFGDTYTSQGTGQLTAGRFEVTYALTDDRRLRLKTFASTNVDIGTRNRNRGGVGVSWRRSFDSFAELFGAVDPGG